MEAKFRAHGVRSDDLKFCVVVDNLDKDTMLEIADFIESPPATDKYTRLKETLIARVTDSDEKRWKKLLTDVELGDRKPTNLLREMRRLTGNSVNEQLLQTLWLQRMPPRIQELLSVLEGVPLEKMAEVADKAIERTFPSVATVDRATTSETVTLAAIEQLIQRQIQQLVISQDSRRPASPSPRRPRSRASSASRGRGQRGKYCYYHCKFGKNARNCSKPCAWNEAREVKQPDNAEN